MPLKNGNTVAAERRMDLASLFCMIGRHGPAVALAVIAIVSVLAAFIIYRTVRGKRRKATANHGDSGSPGADRDASVIPPRESHSSVESTDVSDEGSSDVKQDVEPIQSDLNLRHRRAAAAAAEKKPPLYSPPESDIQVPANKRSTSDNTEEMAAVLDSHEVAETYVEEATPSLQSDTYTEAEMVVEDAVDCQQGETDDVIKDVLEEVHDNDSCWKKPEPISVENHKEEEEVLEAECQEEEDVTTDKDVSDNAREKEENSQCALNSPVRFEQTLNENSDDDRLQDNKTINDKESNSEEPAIHIEDIPVPLICHGEDEEFLEEYPESIDYSSYSGNTHLSPEEEEKNEGDEAKGECEDQQLIGQHDEIWSSTSEQEINLPSTQQEQCDDVTDEVTWPIQDSGWVEDDDLSGEEVADEDSLNKLTAAKFDTRSSEFDKQDAEIEQEENCLTCDQDEGVLYSDQGKEKMLTLDDIVACSEEHNSSSVTSSPAVPCLSAPVKVDNHHDGLSGVTTDAKAQISGISEFPDSSTDCQPPQKEDEIAPSVDEDFDTAVLGPQMPSNDTDHQPENNNDGTTMVLAKEPDDRVTDPHVQSCCEDQQSVQTIRNKALTEASVASVPDIVICDDEIITTPIMAEIFDKAGVAADPETVENVPSVIVEDVSLPQLPSICQDQQICIGKNKAFDKARANSTTDAVACNDASLTALLTSEEKSHSDMLSSSQDQKSDRMENNTFEETKVNSAIEAPGCDNAAITSPIISAESHTGMFFSYQDQQSDQSASPVMIEDMDNPIHQYHLLNLEPCNMRDNDVSSAYVGEESGISSMTVSPDAGNEFDVIFENMPLPVMNYDLQSKGQSEAQNHFFADNVALSMIKENTAGMVFGPYPSYHSEPPHSELSSWTTYESFAANEDVFGHEVEDSYHRAMDEFSTQIADGVTSFTDELEKQDVKVVVEDVEVKEKKVGVSAVKKEETKAEEEEEDYEKTEISIMEATMDHNEWIMDSNYQVLPWMNLSAPSFADDHTKTNQLPTEECQSSSAVTDTTCTDTDIPPSTEVKQTSTLSLVDENTETNKKVVAVQPMTQNVNVTFRVHYLTYSPYQTVAITGNQQELGNWKGFVPLERAKDGHWSVVVSLPAESHVEWKFVVVDKGEVCRWEECGNRLLDTGFGDDLLVHKWWGRL